MSHNAELPDSTDRLREPSRHCHHDVEPGENVECPVGYHAGTSEGEGKIRLPSRDLPKRKRGRVRTNARSSRSMSLKTLAKEYIWLWDVRHGVSINEIATREGVSLPRVRFGVARARAQERSCPTEAAIRPPRLIPLFPMGPFTPQSACGHNRPIEPGSLFCCVVCHCSGFDDHPALQRHPLTEPAPEPKPAPSLQRTARETRKQRRQRTFGVSSLMSAS